MAVVHTGFRLPTRCLFARGLLGFSFWALSAYLLAADTPHIPLDLDSLGSPTFESFGPRDGLPDGVLTSITVDRDGFVWATSPRGIFRFEGHRWVRKLDGQAGRIHRRILNTSEGETWFPSQDGGIARWNGTGWRIDRASNSLPTDKIYAVAELPGSGKSDIWLLTVDSGLYFGGTDGWKPDPGNESLPTSMLLATAVTHRIFGEPRQWLATGTMGLWFRPLAETQWQRFSHPRITGQVEDLKVVNDADGEALWVSNFAAGVFRLGEQGETAWTQEDGTLPSNVVYNLAVDLVEEGQAVIWVASRMGVVRIQGDRAEAFDRRHGLPSNQVRSVWLWETDRGEKVLWLATESGVARTVFTDDQWRNASLLGSDGLGVFGVYLEPDGDGSERLWVASHGDGLGLFEKGEWRIFNREGGDLPSNSLRMVRRIEDLSGERPLWVGLEGGDVVQIADDFSVAPFEVPWEKRNGQILMDMVHREVIVDGRSERELWFATRLEGIYRLSSKGWEAFGTDPYWETVAVLAQTDRSGRSWIWVTTQLGLMRFDGERFERVEGAPSGRLVGLTLTETDDRQILWVGSSFAGLGRMDVTEPENPIPLDPSEFPPPIHSAVYGATLDSTGRVYICTNDGVQQLTPMDDGQWQERVYRRRDGMVHEECNTNAQFMDPNDRFWTGTLGGLTVFNPGGEEPANADEPAPLHLISARVDGLDVGLDSTIVATDNKRIELEFYLQTLHREDETRYRTRVDGLDTPGSGWIRDYRRTFSRLPPGEYTVEVEAMDHRRRPSLPLSVNISIKPRLIQHPAFRFLLVLTVIGAMSSFVVWRINSLRGQKQKLEDEVNQRTAELGEVNRKLEKLSYTDSLTGLSNRRHFMDTVRSALGKTEDANVLIFMDVDHFKRFNDEFGHPAGDEALRTVALVLSELAPDGALAARYGGEEFACFIPSGSLNSVAELAEDLRESIERRPVPIPGKSTTEHITVSVGVADGTLHNENDMHALLREVDAALYRAKGQGRNCVVVA